MSDATQPGQTRLSRRALRERAAQIEAEQGGGVPTSPAQANAGPVTTGRVSTAPVNPGQVNSAQVSSTPAAARPGQPVSAGVPSLMGQAPANPDLSVVELDTAPTQAAPTSRVVRRSATVLGARRGSTPGAAIPGTAARTAARMQGAAAAQQIGIGAPVTGVGPATTTTGMPYAPPVQSGNEVYEVAQRPLSQFAGVSSQSHGSPFGPGTATGAPPAIPWAAITSGDHPDVVAPVPPAVGGEHHALRSAANRVPPPSAGYTWLQYLILVIVAFVLGLLLWQLIIGETPLGDVLHLGWVAVLPINFPTVTALWRRDYDC